MRSDDLFVDDLHGPRRFDATLIDQLRRAPLPDRDDLEVAVALARLLHDDLEKFGTDGSEELSATDMRDGLRALRAVTARLGVKSYKVPFRDFSSFKSWWVQNDAYGNWQARRDLLHGIFEPLHEELAHLEQDAYSATLVTAISPHARTGWRAVDAEISELRRHFQNARTPQDYRAVGLDCVAVTEALSRTVYDPAVHLKPNEAEPPVANTKQRLDRFIECSAPGPDNAAVRKVARAVIELAQHVKHSSAPTRREAGIAGDAVIQLANLLRRLAEL